jgi:sialate O-acetylesterase
MKVKAGKAILSFKHDDGLRSRDGQPLTWFSIAGADGKYVPALAEIRGDKVIVSSSEVKSPVNVRFAWNETAMPNLVNRAGLPAVPFRSNKLEWNYKK